MNETQLLQSLSEANAYPAGRQLPEEIWTPDLALREIERRIGMSQDKTHTTERPATGQVADKSTPASVAGRKPIWNRARYAFAAAAAVVVVATVALLLPGEEEGLIAGQPPGPLDAYVTALQANDSAAAMAVLSEDVLDGFTPWLVGSDTSGMEVSNCEIRNEATQFVACDVDMGPNFFYSLIGGSRDTQLWANIEGTRIKLIDIPNPDGNVAGSRFRDWVSEFHPDRYQELFDDSAGQTEKTVWSEDAARLQFEFLDDYLEYLASQG